MSHVYQSLTHFSGTASTMLCSCPNGDGKRSSGIIRRQTGPDFPCAGETEGMPDPGGHLMADQVHMCIAIEKLPQGEGSSRKGFRDQP
jgi:hypothetical protein